MATANEDWTKNLPEGYSGLLAASKAQAVSGSFDESKGVAGRVQSITAAGGPLMQAARTRAAQAMQKRGTLNTSLAGQAGEQAVIDSASPIASADAQMYQQQQIENQRSANDANKLNAQLTAQVGTEGFRLGENSRQFDKTLGWDQEKFGTGLVEQRRQFDQTLGLDRDRLGLSRDELAQRNAQFAQTLGLDRERLGLSRDELAQRNAQFDKTLGLDRERLGLSRDELAQRGQQFTDSLALDRERVGLSRDELAQRADQFAQSLGIDREKLGLSRDEFTQRIEQFAQTLGLDKERLGISRDELGLRGREIDQRGDMFDTEQTNKRWMAQLDADTRSKLSQDEAKYRTDISSNENISRAWGSMMEQIGQVQNNPDLEPGAKATLIQNSRTQFGQFAEFWKKASGGNVDVSDLLSFGPLPFDGQQGGGARTDNEHDDTGIDNTGYPGGGGGGE